MPKNSCHRRERYLPPPPQKKKKKSLLVISILLFTRAWPLHHLYENSFHSKFQPSYAKLLGSNVTHDSNMINQQNLGNAFSILFSSKQTAYLQSVAKTNFSVSLRRCKQPTHSVRVSKTTRN